MSESEYQWGRVERDLLLVLHSAICPLTVSLSPPTSSFFGFGAQWLSSSRAGTNWSSLIFTHLLLQRRGPPHTAWWHRLDWLRDQWLLVPAAAVPDFSSHLPVCCWGTLDHHHSPPLRDIIIRWWRNGIRWNAGIEDDTNDWGTGQ